MFFEISQNLVFKGGKRSKRRVFFPQFFPKTVILKGSPSYTPSTHQGKPEKELPKRWPLRLHDRRWTWFWPWGLGVGKNDLGFSRWKNEAVGKKKQPGLIVHYCWTMLNIGDKVLAMWRKVFLHLSHYKDHVYWLWPNPAHSTECKIRIFGCSTEHWSVWLKIVISFLAMKRSWWNQTAFGVVFEKSHWFQWISSFDVFNTGNIEDIEDIESRYPPSLFCLWL